MFPTSVFSLKSLTAGLICLAAFGAAANAAQVTGDVREVPAAIGEPTMLNPKAAPVANYPLHLDFELKSANLSQLTPFINDSYDRKSSSYHHWLTPQEFGARFGSGTDDIHKVTAYLQSEGFKNIHVWSNNLFVSADTTKSQAEVAFGMQIQGYNRRRVVTSGNKTSTSYFAPDSEPKLPSEIADCITGIVGMSSKGMKSPMGLEREPRTSSLLQQATGSLSKKHPAFTLQDGINVLDPADLSTVYNVDAIHALGYFGQGMRIAIFSPTTFVQSDINNFSTYNDLVPSITNIIQVDATPPDDSDAEEAAIDIETIEGQAPLALLDVYEENINNADNGLDTFQQIADDDKDEVVSESYGTFEDEVDASYATAFETIRSQMATQGQSIFVSSGDTAAYDANVTTADPNGAVSVSVDASSDYVTGVGGTELENLPPTPADPYWQSEIAWSLNDGSFGTEGEPYGSSGGLSIYYPLPSWQTGTGVDVAGTSNGFRQVPDVSALAATPYYHIFFDTDGSTDGGYGGTSASCPLWASAALLMDEADQKRNGVFGPLLYPVGTNQSFAYHDITSGNNGLYSCTAGWDFVTGWGSADFGSLYAAFHGATAPEPAIPTGVSARNGLSEVVISWVGVPNATYYVLSRANFSYGEFQPIQMLTPLAVNQTAVSAIDSTGLVGQEYYYVVSAFDANGGSARSAVVSGIPQGVLHAFVPGLQMFTIPYSFSSIAGSSISTVISGLVDPSQNSTDVIAAYDPNLESYVTSPDPPATYPVPGVGYFGRFAESGGSLISTGLTVTSEQYAVSLVPGWNLIGNPYISSPTFASVPVLDATGEISLAAAVKAGDIYDVFYDYNGSEYISHGPSDTVTAFDGFWVEAFKSCTLQFSHP